MICGVQLYCPPDLANKTYEVIYDLSSERRVGLREA